MRCPKCNGNRYYLDCGFIQKKCPKCNGGGLIDAEEYLEEEEIILRPRFDDILLNAEIVSVRGASDKKAQKKRGRPKKIIA